MKDNKERLAKKSIIYLIGNLSSKILNFLLVPIYAYTISANDLGNYDYIITLANIVIPIVYISLWEAILKYMLAQKAEENKIITTSALFIVGINILLIPILYIIFKYFYNIGVDEVYIIGIFILYGLTNVWQYYTRALKHEKIYVCSAVIATVINLVLSIITICIFRLGFKGLAISYILSNLISIFIIEFKLKIIKNIRIKYFDYKLLKEMIKFSAPLVLNSVSAWLLSGASKIIIINKLGSTENGIYTFANKFSVIVTLIGSVINMAFVEESILNSKSEKVDENFLNTVEFLIKKFMSILILAIPAINIFYYIIGTTEYYNSKMYFPFLLIYSLLSIMATNIGTIFHVVNKTKYAFFTTLLGACIFGIICLIGIDKYGLMSVIIAQIIGAFIMFIVRYIFTKKYVQDKFKWIEVIVLFVAYIIVSIISYKSNVIVNSLIFIIIFIILFYYNRKTIFNMYKKIMKRGKYE